LEKSQPFGAEWIEIIIRARKFINRGCLSLSGLSGLKYIHLNYRDVPVKWSQPFGAEWIEICLCSNNMMPGWKSQPFGAEWIEIYFGTSSKSVYYNVSAFRG